MAKKKTANAKKAETKAPVVVEDKQDLTKINDVFTYVVAAINAGLK